MDQASLKALAELSLGPFVPRAPWWGGDLQTLSNYLRPRRVPLDAYAHERLELPLGDGTGDRLAATLSRPASDAGKPLVVLIHGLSGDEVSAYILRTAAHLLAAGYPVLRLNLRGAGRSRALCRLQYHGGRSEDLAMALAALPPGVAPSGIAAVGYSLGGNMLLKFLGEHGAASPLRAAISVSAPIDLAACAQRMLRRRNAVYQAYLMREMRAEAVAPISDVSAAERGALRAARTVWDFDTHFTAPRNGFAGAEDYYRRNSAQHHLAGIRVPTLVIHALDDPWVPAAPYLAVDWRSNSALMPLLAPRGGHVGFLGRERDAAWHDRAIARFLDAAFSRI